ncbi:MAG: hypothetical protein ABFD63_09510 [Smithella sp.]
MSKKTGEQKRQNTGEVLTMPGQFQVMPLHHLLKKVMEDDLRQYCIERGLKPDDYMPEWPEWVDE